MRLLNNPHDNASPKQRSVLNKQGLQKIKSKTMNTLKFKTNINCSGCVAAVTPVLNEVAGKDNWNVDTQNPSKVLTVNTDLPEANITRAIANAGYKIESLVSVG